MTGGFKPLDGMRPLVFAGGEDGDACHVHPALLNYILTNQPSILSDSGAKNRPCLADLAMLVDERPEP